MSSTLIRFVALPFVITAVFLSYGYGLDFTNTLLDIATLRQYYATLGLPLDAVRSLVLLSFFVPHFFLVALLAFVFSHIAVRIYGQQALTVAILSVLPVLYLRAGELFQPLSYLNRYSSIASLTISAFEIGSFVLLICLGTWLVSRQNAKQQSPPLSSQLL